MNDIEVSEVLRRECAECDAPATKRLTFLIEDGRRNPASSAYGHDDCSYCSDYEAFSCDGHVRYVEHNECPDGMRWCSTYTYSDRFKHLFMYRSQVRDESAIRKLLKAWLTAHPARKRPKGMIKG